MEPILEMRGITKRFGGLTALDAVTLSVRPGEVFGLIGPNGSGKSSLLRLLAGLKRPQSGAVEIEGQDIARIPRRALARQLAFVQQSASTDTNVSVRRNSGSMGSTSATPIISCTGGVCRTGTSAS